MKKQQIIVIVIILLAALLLVMVFVKTPFQNTQQEPKKFYCDNVSRNAICNDVGDRVCGWFNQSVKCLKYPCAIEFSLRCEACKNTEVEYYTFGACLSG